MLPGRAWDKMRRWLDLIAVVVLGAGLVACGGCAQVQDAMATHSWQWLSPGSVIAPPPRAQFTPILTELGAADSQQVVLSEASEPTEADLVYSDSDYVIGPEDVLDVSIMDLFEEGRETAIRRAVTPSGLLSIPEYPRQIRAEGLTTVELEKAIKAAYEKAEILRKPTVQVTVFAQRSAAYTVISPGQGGGRYSISQKGMTLLDALAPVGGLASNPTVTYIYVYRGAQPVREHTEEEAAEEAPAPESAMSREASSAPGAGEAGPGAGSSVVAPAAPGIRAPGLPQKQDVFNVAVPGAPAAPASGPGNAPTTLPDRKSVMDVVVPGVGGVAAPADMGRFSEMGAATASGPVSRGAGRWEFRDGQWVQAGQASGPDAARSAATNRSDAKPAAAPAPGAKGDDPFGWSDTDRTSKRRVIAIHVKRLLDNDRKMNIVVRDKDIIRIPEPLSGEFYVAGEVARPGVYSLTGRQITIKMALTAAGNPQGLPDPRNAILYRRLEGNQEMVMPVNVEAIFKGEEPDMYLRPDDIIAVGSSPRAYWLSIVRYAFRLTYGFGFIYDRNFAPSFGAVPDTGSQRFTRW